MSIQKAETGGKEFQIQIFQTTACDHLRSPEKIDTHSGAIFQSPFVNAIGFIFLLSVV